MCRDDDAGIEVLSKFATMLIYARVDWNIRTEESVSRIYKGLLYSLRPKNIKSHASLESLISKLYTNLCVQ